jgi:alpha-tubulin suppressor-like RCC1 family protein
MSTSRLWIAILLSVFGMVPLNGCFTSRDVSKLKCTTSEHCPSGYVCSGVPGKCVNARLDGGSPDLLSNTEAGGSGGEVRPSDTISTDSRGEADINLIVDGPTTNSDTPTVIDQLPALADLGLDVPSDAPISPPDTPADNMVLVPDLGPEGPDVAPDLPYGPEVGPDVPPTSCVIGGTSYVNGAANPANSCQVCRLTTSLAGWSNADEGTSCGSGQYCNGGTCKAGCFISGAYYANGSANPANACQTCRTTYALTSWTTSGNGDSCGTGQVCNGGVCQSGCWIEGALVGSGTANSSNVCQICRPAASTSGWSSNTDGTSCGSQKICGAGTCQAGCYMGGAVYATGALNPATGCQSCNPSISTLAWYQVPSDCAIIAAHDGFTCATTGGAVKCWGTNSDGNLGQSYGQTSYSAVPIAISALGTSVQAVSTGGGSSQACATVGGGIKCWGRNDYGQLGNGTTSSSYIPVQVAGLTSGVLGVATGESFSCALLNGQVRCWGTNTNGQLGMPASQGATPPVTVTFSGNIQAIAAGASYACALVSGSVWCWGANSHGQLGNNSTTDSYLPVQAVGLGSNVQAIAAGRSHTCAIANGSLSCWGYNSDGQVGDGTTTDRWAPVPVQGLSSGVEAVANGTYHTCAIVNGGAWCWGMNLDGELGDNSTTARSSPVAVQGLGSGVQTMTAGYNHSCALTSAGAKCWGNNTYGELGSNSTASSLTPVSVQGL